LQVFWLIAAFGWGCLQFFANWSMYPRGNSDWTFGQVVPVLLLASPLLAIIEFLYPGRHFERTSQGSESMTDNKSINKNLSQERISMLAHQHYRQEAARKHNMSIHKLLVPTLPPIRSLRLLLLHLYPQ
jgi:hypothetical protein